MPGLVVLTVIILFFVAVLHAESVHRRASRRGLPASSPSAPFTEAIVVLGFRNRGARANAVNRYRVRAGLRSIAPDAAQSILVLCGGPIGSAVPEAVIMANHARRCGYRGRIALEDESRTTEENIRNAIPLIEDADAIRIVSNSLHAEMARSVLAQHRPDLAARLRPAQEHRFGEVVAQKLYSTVRVMLR
ncbi:YdcF family protein [Microbacterium tumbae]